VKVLKGFGKTFPKVFPGKTKIAVKVLERGMGKTS